MYVLYYRFRYCEKRHTMKRTIWLYLVLFLLLSDLARDAYARGARGGGMRGGGMRASAARAAASRSTPANYGSLRSAQPLPSRSVDTSQYRGETRTIDTRRGGNATVGVSERGDVAVRGTTAGGRNYGGLQVNGGDRVVVGKLHRAT